MTLLIDTHTHVTSGDLKAYPRSRASTIPSDWLDETAVDVDALACEMKAAGVDRAILVQAFGAYQFDNRYVTDSQARHSDIFASTVVIDPSTADPKARLIDLHQRGARGLRLFSIPTPDEPWIDAPESRPIWEAAADLDYRIVACVLAPELPVVGRAADANPDLVVAIDHCGFADFTGGPPFEQASPLWDLAGKPNVRLKVTTTLLDQAESYGGDGSEIVDALAERFGAERMMWGSDYPQVHDRAYADTLASARRAAFNLSARQQMMFFGGTALSLWPELS